MIIRARPKYISKEHLFYTDKRLDDNSLQMYFGTGRAALKFYLTYLLKNGLSTIAMQSFNCRVVGDAALEAGCNICLMDVKMSDCSISFRELKSISTKIDILLLTHYQGMPNNEYDKIANYCDDHEIVLIEDLAHVYNDKGVDNFVGSRSRANIYSFAFDKPLSCQEGGMLEIKKENPSLNSQYSKLPIEKEENALLDIQVLSFLFKYSSKNKYHKGINNVWFLKKMLSNNISETSIYFYSKFLINKYIRHFISKILLTKSSSKNIEVYRLNLKKKLILFEQSKNFEYSDGQKINHLINICKKLDVENFQNSDSINWNRFSVIDRDGVLNNFFSKQEIEVGNYNWPIPLHRIYKNNPQVTYHSQFTSSQFLAENILNIPLWSDEIFKIDLTSND